MNASVRPLNATACTHLGAVPVRGQVRAVRRILGPVDRHLPQAKRRQANASHGARERSERINANASTRTNERATTAFVVNASSNVQNLRNTYTRRRLLGMPSVLLARMHRDGLVGRSVGWS